MKKEIINTNKYNIDNDIIKNYCLTMNKLTIPTSTIKGQLSLNSESLEAKNDLVSITSGKENNNYILIEKDNLKNILSMINALKKKLEEYPKNKEDININVIKKIANENNGFITTRLLEPLNINREYLSILEKNKEIERIARGIYITSSTLQDDFYAFQLKYKKAVFSHMNALYFQDLTEEIPYNFTVTVPNNYHDASLNENCNVFYTDEKTYELGLCEVKTPSGNIIRTYDLERCICDIIRSKNRMDFEQVKKSVKQYVKRKDKNMLNLSKYAKQMNITKDVMEMIGMYYE